MFANFKERVLYFLTPENRSERIWMMLAILVVLFACLFLALQFDV